MYTRDKDVGCPYGVFRYDENLAMGYQHTLRMNTWVKYEEDSTIYARHTMSLLCRFTKIRIQHVRQFRIQCVHMHTMYTSNNLTSPRIHTTCTRFIVTIK